MNEQLDESMVCQIEEKCADIVNVNLSDGYKIIFKENNKEITFSRQGYWPTIMIDGIILGDKTFDLKVQFHCTAIDDCIKELDSQIKLIRNTIERAKEKGFKVTYGKNRILIGSSFWKLNIVFTDLNIVTRLSMMTERGTWSTSEESFYENKIKEIFEIKKPTLVTEVEIKPIKFKTGPNFTFTDKSADSTSIITSCDYLGIVTIENGRVTKETIMNPDVEVYHHIWIWRGSRGFAILYRNGEYIPLSKENSEFLSIVEIESHKNFKFSQADKELIEALIKRVHNA